MSFDPDLVSLTFEGSEVNRAWLQETLDQRISWLMDENALNIEKESKLAELASLEVKVSLTDASDYPQLTVSGFFYLGLPFLTTNLANCRL